MKSATCVLEAARLVALRVTMLQRRTVENGRLGRRRRDWGRHWRDEILYDNDEKESKEL